MSIFMPCVKSMESGVEHYQRRPGLEALTEDGVKYASPPQVDYVFMDLHGHL